MSHDLDWNDVLERDSVTLEQTSDVIDRPPEEQTLTSNPPTQVSIERPPGMHESDFADVMDDVVDSTGYVEKPGEVRESVNFISHKIKSLYNKGLELYDDDINAAGFASQDLAFIGAAFFPVLVFLDSSLEKGKNAVNFASYDGVRSMKRLVEDREHTFSSSRGDQVVMYGTDADTEDGWIKVADPYEYAVDVDLVDEVYSEVSDFEA